MSFSDIDEYRVVLDVFGILVFQIRVVGEANARVRVRETKPDASCLPDHADWMMVSTLYLLKVCHLFFLGNVSPGRLHLRAMCSRSYHAVCRLVARVHRGYFAATRARL